MECTMNTIELFNEDKSPKIRCYKDDNNTYMFAVFDFINLLTKRDQFDKYGKYMFYNSFSKNEQTQMFVKLEFKTSNNRSYQTYCCNIIGLTQVLFRIPSKIREGFNGFSNRTLTVVLTDDKSILTLIEINSESNQFIQQIYRYILETHENMLTINSLNDKIKSLNADLELRTNQADILLRENFKLFQKVNSEKENSEIY